MRIRYPFAGAFLLLTLLAAYLGLTAIHIPQLNDKVLHFVTFFLLTITFYWILDTTRRRVLHITLLVITFGLGLGSEVLQSLLPNGRNFDAIDIAANVVGSLGALGLCAMYHKRMFERKRRRKGYGIVSQEGDDLEMAGQEQGVVDAHADDEAWDDMGGEESGDGEGNIGSDRGGAEDDGDGKK